MFPSFTGFTSWLSLWPVSSAVDKEVSSSPERVSPTCNRVRGWLWLSTARKVVSHLILIRPTPLSSWYSRVIQVSKGHLHGLNLIFSKMVAAVLTLLLVVSLPHFMPKISAGGEWTQQDSTTNFELFDVDFVDPNNGSKWWYPAVDPEKKPVEKSNLYSLKKAIID